MRVTLVGLYNGEMHTITTEDFSSNELTQLKEMMDRRYDPRRNQPRVMGAHSNGPLMPSGMPAPAREALERRLKRMLSYGPARQIDERRTQLRKLNALLGYEKASDAIRDGHHAAYQHMLENWDADDLEATNEASKGRALEHHGQAPAGNVSDSGRPAKRERKRKRRRGSEAHEHTGDRWPSDVPQRLGFDGSGTGDSE